jgi:hypothetical protein
MHASYWIIFEILEVIYLRYTTSSFIIVMLGTNVAKLSTYVRFVVLTGAKMKPAVLERDAI